MTALRRLVGYALAVPVAFAAGLRVCRLERRLPFDRLVDELRRASRLPSAAADPIALGRVVGRLAPALPPWGMGRCLKRSLLLVHLWARCGLQPRLHLGFLGERRGHAWVTGGPFAPSSEEQAAEVAAL